LPGHDGDRSGCGSRDHAAAGQRHERPVDRIGRVLG
jgi:hypothetical protein